MKFICSQCQREFKSLDALLNHCKIQHGSVFTFIQVILQHFYPNCCPYCERELEMPSESDIRKFIEEN